MIRRIPFPKRSIHVPDYLEPDLTGGAYLYSKSEDVDNIFSYVVTLTMSVSETVLSRTLEEILQRFPHFAVRPVRKGESYVYESCDTPVRVYRSDSKPAGAFTCNDGRLFIVSYSHKTIYFDFHRALTDIKGALVFIRSVIFRYLQNTGYEVENDGGVLTLETPFFEMEAEDALEGLEDIPASRPVWYMDAKAHIDKTHCSSATNNVCQIHIPISSIKGELKEGINMVSSFITPFFSQCMLEEYELDDNPAGEFIVSSIKINLRQYFPTPTTRPFYIDATLAYNRKLADYPVSTVLMSQKKLLEAQLKSDALAYNAQQKIKILDDLRKLPSFGQKVAKAGEIFSNKASTATYSLCNAGAAIMPESVNRYITEFYPIVPAVLYPHSISAVIFKGDLVINVASVSDNRELCRKFTALLNRYGMCSYISDDFKYTRLEYQP